MSDEQEDLIEKTFVQELGAKYPMIKIDGRATREYGIEFYPSVYCIDANGQVHSVPKDRMPDEATIEKLLEGVTLAPKLPEDARYDPLRLMWSKRQYKKIDDYLGKLLQQEGLDLEMREVYATQHKALGELRDKQVGLVARLGSGPDYHAALEHLERIEREWGGMLPADAAQEQIKRFKSDATIKKELAAGKALDKILSSFDPSKVSQAKKLKEELGKFAKRYEGTYAAEKATKMLGD